MKDTAMKLRIVFLSAVMILLFFTCCSKPQNPDSVDSKKVVADQTKEDDTSPAEDEIIAPAIPTEECEQFCSKETAATGMKCELLEKKTLDSAIQECITRCKTGEFLEAAKPCFDKFKDCKPLVACLEAT